MAGGFIACWLTAASKGHPYHRRGDVDGTAVLPRGGARRANRRTNREKGIAYNIAYGLLTNKRVEIEIV
jgi:hypothetical protein